MERDAGLGSQTEQVVEDLVSSGMFETRDDVLREGVRLLQAKKLLTELDAALAESIAQADAGQVIPIEQVRAEMQQRYANWPGAH